MNFCWKSVLHSLFFVIFFNPSFGAENLNEGSLRAISKHIISKDHIFDAIKLKLRQFHCVDAKSVWSNYNYETLPKSNQPAFQNTIQVGNLSGVPQKQIARFAGKTDNTFYTEVQINSIETEVTEAVDSGVIVINPKNENQILITYNLNINFGELCLKNKTLPFNPQCQDKQIIEIVLDAEHYLHYVRINGVEHLKSQNFACKINNIYSK